MLAAATGIPVVVAASCHSQQPRSLMQTRSRTATSVTSASRPLSHVAKAATRMCAAREGCVATVFPPSTPLTNGCIPRPAGLPTLIRSEACAGATRASTLKGTTPTQRRTVSANASEASKQPAQDETPSSGLWASAVQWWTSQRTRAYQYVHAAWVSTIHCDVLSPTLVGTPSANP